MPPLKLKVGNGADFQKVVEGGSTEEILKAFCGVATEEAMQTGKTEGSKWLVTKALSRLGIDEEVSKVLLDVVNLVGEEVADGSEEN